MSGHNQFALLTQRRFLPFFLTQSLGAFNDNVFRNATLALIAFQMGLDHAQVTLYSNLAPALFILPFFLFSATAGQFADKYEKSRIIRYVKVFEIGIMIMGSPGGNFNVQTMQADALPRFRMGIVISAQNMTNHANYVGYNGTLTSPFFGQPTSVQAMRKIEVGLNFNF